MLQMKDLEKRKHGRKEGLGNAELDSSKLKVEGKTEGETARIFPTKSGQADCKVKMKKGS